MKHYDVAVLGGGLVDFFEDGNGGGGGRPFWPVSF